MSISLTLIGYASGLAANNVGCGDGPSTLKAHHFEDQLFTQGIDGRWIAMLTPEPYSQEDRLMQVAVLNGELAEITHRLTNKEQRFLVIGGDHSSAVGTWSGVASALLPVGGALGLIWIDAHMDSHTMETTPSGNIHGMPLAALLGYGDPSLTEILSALPKLSPEHVCLIGTRSFETEEAALLRRLGVRIYEMPEIKRRGMLPVLQEAISRVKDSTSGFGVSLDLDAIDPKDAPGVGVPELDGLTGEALCEALTLLRGEKQFLGLEIAEYNPHLDDAQKTERLIQKLVLAIFAR